MVEDELEKNWLLLIHSPLSAALTRRSSDLSQRLSTNSQLTPLTGDSRSSWRCVLRSTGTSMERKMIMHGVGSAAWEGSQSWGGRMAAQTVFLHAQMSEVNNPRNKWVSANGDVGPDGNISPGGQICVQVKITIEKDMRYNMEVRVLQIWTWIWIRTGSKSVA